MSNPQSWNQIGERIGGRMRTLIHYSTTINGREFTLIDHRRVPCDACGAAVGKACKLPSGYYLSQGHSIRQKHARQDASCISSERLAIMHRDTVTDPAQPLMRATENMPDWVQAYFPNVREISIGLCRCPRYGFGGRHTTAHTNYGDGRICIRVGYWSDTYPTTTFLHEYAHILIGRIWTEDGRRNMHGKAWKDTFQTLLAEWGYENIVRHRFSIAGIHDRYRR